MTDLHKVFHFCVEAGREREERGTGKMCVATVQHNAALRTRTHAHTHACTHTRARTHTRAHTHTRSIHSQKSCVLFTDFSI